MKLDYYQSSDLSWSLVIKNGIEIGGGYKNPAEVEVAYKKMMGLLNESLDKYYRVDSLYIKAVITSENYTNNTYLPFVEAFDEIENEYITAHPATSKQIDVLASYREALLSALLTRMKAAEIFYEYYLSKNKINESHSISTKDNLYLLDGSGNRPIHVIHNYPAVGSTKTASPASDKPRNEKGDKAKKILKSIF